ncbi:E3 ubiquitin-protein ligase RNF186-like [Notolabrus celidotus]|uniref:E3 ubiquitin-protein ligase RNF186-like n=1 Tax=Notolabrus celidotus TaxID=1203425 RepID=UPI0014906169|nr:E3 ubiquitin-protein ligase RNF186-like [Notolabrus celidotus]
MAEVDTEGDECGSDPSGRFPSEEYECKICYNDFDLDLHIPKLLGCSHTFCKECLDTLHSREGRGWRIGCPVCRHRTPVPEYRVSNLPDNTTICDALPLKSHEPVNSSKTDVLVTGPTFSPAASQESDDSCQTCKQVAFVTGCACAIFSFLSMVVLLFMGLIFVHNFNNKTSSVGPICLFVASILALFSLIFTWIVCMLKYRPETETSNFSSLTSNMM